MVHSGKCLCKSNELARWILQTKPSGNSILWENTCTQQLVTDGNKLE